VSGKRRTRWPYAAKTALPQITPERVFSRGREPLTIADSSSQSTRTVGLGQVGLLASQFPGVGRPFPCHP